MTMFWESLVTRKPPHFSFYALWTLCRTTLNAARTVKSTVWTIVEVLIEVHTHRIYLCCLLVKVMMYYKPWLSFLEDQPRGEGVVMTNTIPTTKGVRNISMSIAAAILLGNVSRLFDNDVGHFLSSLCYLAHASVFVLSPGVLSRIPALPRYLFLGTSNGTILLFLHLVMTVGSAFLQLYLYGWTRRPHEGHNVIVAYYFVYTTYEQISS
eukprot:PhF_6_TR11146/c0_g1_i1/m.17968